MIKINGKDVEIWGNLICGNEDINVLKRCLDSIKPYCDKILVGFNGSDPKVEEVLKSYKNLEYFKQVWNDNFYDMRTEVWDKTPKGVLVLWMDTDDVLIIKDGVNFKSHCEEIFNKPFFSGIICYWDYLRDKEKNVLADLWRERIVYKDGHKWTKRMVHEVLMQTDERIWAISYDMSIFHLATMEKILKSGKRNLEICQAQYEKEKAIGIIPGQTLYDLARSLQGVGKHDDALKYYREYIEMSSTSEFERAIAMTICSEIYRSTGQFRRAKECAMDVILLAPELPDGYIDLGHAAFGAKNYRQAVTMFEMSFSFPPSKVFPIDPTKYGIKTQRVLVVAYIQTGKIDRAYKMACDVLKKVKDDKAMLEAKRTCEQHIKEMRVMDNIIELEEMIDYSPEKVKHFLKAIPKFADDHPTIQELKNKYAK